MVTGSTYKGLAVDALTAKATVLRNALAFADSLRIPHIIAESDNLQLVKNLKKDSRAVDLPGFLVTGMLTSLVRANSLPSNWVVAPPITLIEALRSDCSRCRSGS